MTELTLNQLVNVCPRCAGTNIQEDDMWTGIAAEDENKKDVTVTLDLEGDYYILYNYKCLDCGTIFSIKRLESQMD